MALTHHMRESKQIAAFILFSCFLLCSQLIAKPVSVEQARKVADTFLKTENILVEKRFRALQNGGVKAVSPKKFAAAGVKEIYSDDGRILAYVIELEPEGFIITAADDNIRPTLGYSFKGKFPFEDSKQNVLLHLVQWDVNARLKNLEFDTQQISKHAQVNNKLWCTYTSDDEDLLQTLAGESQTQWPEPYYGCQACGRRQDDAGICEICGGSVVLQEGWIATNWSQDSPIDPPNIWAQFNDKCPYDPRYQFTRCVVGCGATAMTQILNYWQYPDSVSFDENDTYTSTFWGNVGLDFWQWFSIEIDNDAGILDFPDFGELDSYVFTYNLSEQPLYPAYLSLATGIKLRTSYSSSGSGAFANAAAYLDGFCYGSAESTFPFIDYDRLKENMKKEPGWPAQLEIGGLLGFGNGHSVVVDGYKDTGEFHLNFGWFGTLDDTWYHLPEDLSNVWVPDVGHPFSAVKFAILDICPYRGWNQWGADEKNSFRTPYVAPTTNPPIDKWSVTSRGVYKMTGVVAGTSNKIYAACSPRAGSDPEIDKSYILVTNQYGEKEKEIIITNENRDILYPVQNKNGDIFVAGQSGEIYKIETSTENPIPTLYFSEPSAETFCSLKIDPDGWLYACTPSKLYIIASPSQWWPFPAPQGTQFYPGYPTPAIDLIRNRVYISYYNESTKTAYLGCVNRLTGQLIGSPKIFPNIPSASKSTGVPSIDSNGNVYVGCNETLYAFTSSYQLQDLWQQTYGTSAITHAPTLSEDGTIYLAYWKNDTEYVVGAVDSTNGDIKWEIPFYAFGEDEYLNIKDLYAASNKVIVFFVHRQVLVGQEVTNTYTLHAYQDNGASNEPIWEKEFEAGGLLAFGPSETIYVIPQVGDENKLYAISEGPRGEPDGGGMAYGNNAGPSIPSKPNPADGAKNQDSTVTLSWDCNDPESHALKYSIFVGESGYDMVPVATDLTDESYTLSGLKPGTGYAWKIIATDGQAVSEGPTWAFATKTQPLVADFCGANSDQPDGYVDYWDLLYFARRWHTSPGDPDWDPRCDLDKEDNYVDYWDLLVFARHWHEGQKP